MQIKLKELLENMTAEGGEQAAPQPAAEGDGVVAASVEDGPSVAAACPPTPRKSISSIQAAIDAASLDDEALAQSEFFNPPPDAPRTTIELDATDVEEQETSSPRRKRRTMPPPPPPKRDDADEEQPEAIAAAAAAAPASDIAEQPTAPSARSSGSMDAPIHGDDEYEPQTFSPSMLSPLSRRPSGVSEAVKPPRRDSGLIDVRSMAAAYREYDGLVKKNKDGHGAEVETAPLPILGSSEHTSPILLPQPTTPSHANRWLYALVAVLGAIVVIGSTVAVTALILKRRDSGGKNFAALAPAERAALCEAETEAARIREDEERIAAARRATAPVPGTVAESEVVTAADVAGTAPMTAPALEISSSSRKSGDDDDDDGDRGHRSSRDRSGRDSEERSASTSRTSSPPATTTTASSPPAPVAPPAPSKPAATDDLAAAAGSASSGGSDGEKCDEVTCLVSGKGCCGKNAKGAGAAKGEAPPPDPNLPARPERSDISAGIASVQNRLQSCGDRHSVRGAVTVKIAIAPSGEVKSASTAQGSSEFQSCIAGALKGAKFPATQQGAKVSYPVVLK